MNNPLVQDFNTSYETAPFSRIRNEHFKPAFEWAIDQAKKEIDQITDNTEDPTFENTMEQLEFSGEKLSRISSIFFNLNSAETNDEIQGIAQEVSPMLSELANDIRLNEALFNRIEKLYLQSEELDLDKEQSMLLEKNYRAFVRNGAKLNEKDKLRLREIDKELSTLSLKFGENILAETNEFQLHIKDEKDLQGLPEGAVEAARMMAKEKDLEGWIITLDYPSYIPFMTYADNRSLREQLFKAFGARGNQDNANDNKKIVGRLVELRHERANLLGYDTHADFVLEERMAETPEKVHDFLRDLLEKSLPAAKQEFGKLQAIAQEDGIAELQRWDAAYYSEKLKQELFDLDDEKLKPYFPLEQVLQGAFEVAERLFDLKFETVDQIDKYHEEVGTYKVSDTKGNYVALLYTDFFPRKGKRNGAWMTSFKNQWRKKNENSRPHISIVCNFTRPTDTKPSLLTFNEVTTLFHEFGHALHGMLADTTYPNLSGTSVYWDFVELPSQVMENWCYEKEALSLFAKHYDKGELIPMDLVQKIKDSSNFLEGLATIRQLSFGMLDMAYHNGDPAEIKDIQSFEKEAFGETQLYPEVRESCMSTAFSHIFQGGYSSGYYSYKWAEVLDADAFEAFKENGIFDHGTASKFKENILSKGGTEKPMDLYKRFRGREPDARALLRRAGLLKEDETA
jgi:peptidyl-dipeptidase Dcp